MKGICLPNLFFSVQSGPVGWSCISWCCAFCWLLPARASLLLSRRQRQPRLFGTNF